MSEDHLCRWRLQGKSDQLGAEHVWLEHAGGQALPAARLQGVGVVQRTFAWLSQSRKLSKDYEITALFSRSLREDRLSPEHSQASGITLMTDSHL